MRIINSLSLIFLAAIIGGCTDTDSLSPVAPAAVDYSNTVSVEEALQNADEHFAKVFGENTRSGRTPASIDLIHRATRSSEDGIEGFYLVNYADDKGFALLSADRRLTPVYAVANEGQLYLTDTLDNKGLSWYLNTAVPLMANGEIFERDTTLHSVADRICETIKTPMLENMMAKFRQGIPYNKYCPVIDGKFAKVGCAPLAAGTIMGYYEYPAVVNGHTMDWKEMKRSVVDSNWAWLFATLGNEDHMRSVYGLDATSTAYNNIWSGFAKEGYKTEGHKNFTVDLQVNELVNNRPTYILGQAYEGGHAWIVDGGYKWTLRFPDEAIAPGTGPVEKVTYYFHCVWGWGGNANGYYLYDNTLGGKPASQREGETGECDYIFSSLSLYTNLVPNI